MPTAQERAAAKSAVTHARSRGKADPDEATQTLASEGNAKRDLDSPTLQFRIENPETMKIVLDLFDLGHDEREITIKTKFSYADVNDRKIIADLESYQTLLIFEVSRTAFGVGDTKWRERFGAYVDIVSKESALREKAAAILAKISTYTETWTSSAGVQGKSVETIHRTPTPDELTIGIDAQLSAAVAAFLLKRVTDLQNEYAARKKARQAVVSD